jgi:TRAP-type C4-dicarboxylate transport system permease small subunit
MAEAPMHRHAPTDRTGIVLEALAKVLALAGGLVVVAMTLMTLASIAGRALFTRPLPGDYELIQLGCAVAVASFLPLTQLRGGHVLVDFFTARSSLATRSRLDALGSFLVGLAGAVFAWRMTAGANSLLEANDQTTILGIPTWYAVALMVPSFALLAATGFYTCWRHLEAARRARRSDTEDAR